MTEIRECDICGQLVEHFTTSTGAHIEREHDCPPPIFNLHEAFVAETKELAALNAAVVQLRNEVAAFRCESARIARVFRAEGAPLSVTAPSTGRVVFNLIGRDDPVVVPAADEAVSRAGLVEGSVTFNFVGLNTPTVVSLSQGGRPGVVEVDKSLSERLVASVPEGLTPNGAPAQ